MAQDVYRLRPSGSIRDKNWLTERPSAYQPWGIGTDRSQILKLILNMGFELDLYSDI